MKVFIDSNVAVYALAGDDAIRRGVALRLIAKHGGEGSLALSTQVLLETYNMLTRKKGIAAGHGLAALRLLATHEVVAPSSAATLRALELAADHKLSTWDALIVQAAQEAGCEVLFSEDFQAGRRFGGLEVVNPFKLSAHEPVAEYRVERQATPKITRQTKSRRTP